MRDLAVVAAVVVAFAALVTVHVLLTVGLARRRPRVRALAAFFVFPLAPYWGFRERMWVRAGAWVVFAAGYVAARILAAG